MKKTQSAGGVIINQDGDVAIVSQKGKSWSLPKGHVESGESTLAAAKREIYEETGLSQLEFLKEIGSYTRYKMGKNGSDSKKEEKTITLYLFKTTEMDLNPIDPKHPEARWVDRSLVAEFLTHPKDKDFFLSIIDMLP